MADVKWIKLSTGLPDNRKIKLIRKLPEGDTIALMWVFLMCLAGETNEDGMVYFTSEIPYTDEMLADQFDMELNTIRLGLATFQKFGMIEIVEDIICLPSWEKWQSTDRLSEIREYNRLAKQKSRAKQKQKLLEDVNDMSMTCQRGHDTEEEKEKEKEEEKRKKKKVHSGEPVKKITKEEVDKFFDSVWDLYPVKKGKGQVSDSRRKVLYEIGFDEIKRAVSRYLEELKKDASWRKPQNGSTFFNSGYVDYLDNNFVPDNETTNTAIPPGNDQTDLDGLF